MQKLLERTTRNKHVGTFGDVSTFSFFGSKTITTGEGGMVVTNDYKIAKKVEKLKMVGNDKGIHYWHNIVGYNYRMTNICCCNWLRTTITSKININKRKEKFSKIYNKKFKKSSALYLHEEQFGTTHTYWMVSIKLKNFKLRDKLRESFK